MLLLVRPVAYYVMHVYSSGMTFLQGHDECISILREQLFLA